MTDLPSFIDITTIRDSRGSLSFLEGDADLGFAIKRIYYLYDVPESEARGAHAHKALRQCMIAMKGRVRVSLDNGHSRQEFLLDSPNRGLMIAPMTWRDLSEFSEDAVVLVLASHGYDEADYIRDYETFLDACECEGKNI